MKNATKSPVKETIHRSDYLGEYNNLLSKVAAEFCDRFAATASPTLSKQETVTLLYQSIKKGPAQGQKTTTLPWRQLVKFVPRLILFFTRVAYASVRFRVNSIPEGAVYFRTWLVPRCFSGEALVDDYFRQLPTNLVANEKVVIGFSELGFGLLNKFSRTRHDDNQIIDYGLLSFFEVIKLFFDYIFSALIQTKKRYYLGGEDVTEHINKSLLLDYLNLRSFRAYVDKYICRKLLLHKIKAFVYVFENQSWEKACCASLRGNNIRLISYQSSGFSPIFLNFFPTEEDARRQPMPEIILTVGNHFSRYLSERGHYHIPVETFAALRFSYPKSGDRYSVQPSNPIILDKILYALPVHIGQYFDILNDLIEVFEDSSIKIDLKPHPLFHLTDIKGAPTLPENFQIINHVDMDSLRDTYDCVLFHDNSFGIEALLKGVKSYQYSRDGSFADDRFMYFDLWQVNYLLSDIYRLKDAIEARSYKKSFDVEAVSDYMNAMYRPYTSGSLDRFCEILNPT
jgi:hypothetical protein